MGVTFNIENLLTCFGFSNFTSSILKMKWKYYWCIHIKCANESIGKSFENQSTFAKVIIKPQAEYSFETQHQVANF